MGRGKLLRTDRQACLPFQTLTLRDLFQQQPPQPANQPGRRPQLLSSFSFEPLRIHRNRIRARSHVRGWAWPYRSAPHRGTDGRDRYCRPCMGECPAAGLRGFSRANTGRKSSLCMIPRNRDSLQQSLVQAGQAKRACKP